MICGVFVDNVPWVEVNVSWGAVAQNAPVVLDTGFSGDLQITPKIASEVGLVSSDIVDVQIANGQIVSVPIVQAISSMEGVQKEIHVLIADSSPLVGISFLSKFAYKAIVDCKNKTVALQKAQ